jgi:hypothetical protein
MQATQTLELQLHPHRPIGIWVIVVCDTLYAMLLAINPLQVLLYPQLEDWSLLSRTAAPIIVLLAACTCISSGGAWLGIRVARTLLLVSLTVLMASVVWDNIVLLSDRQHLIDDLATMTLRGRWNLTVGIRASLWLGINYWYLLGARSRDFFVVKKSAG